MIKQIPVKASILGNGRYQTLVRFKQTINKLLETLIELKIPELVEEKKRYKKYVDILLEGTIL